MYKGKQQYQYLGGYASLHYFGDKTSALKQSEAAIYSTQQMIAPEADIILSMKNLWQNNGWTPSFSNVKRHQTSPNHSQNLHQQQNIT